MAPIVLSLDVKVVPARLPNSIVGLSVVIVRVNSLDALNV